MTVPIPIRTPQPNPSERVDALTDAITALRAEIAALTAALRTAAALTGTSTTPVPVPAETQPPAAALLRFAGGLEVDQTASEVRLDDVPVRMTRREYQLATFLASHPRRLFSREELLEQVWGTRYQEPATVTEHIRRIRLLLAPLDPISTVRGVGYRWDATPAPAPDGDR